MNTLIDNKSTLAIIGIFAVIIICYQLLFKPDETLSTDSPTVEVGNEVLEIFADLEKITLDQALFSTNGYLLLTDFSTTIPPGVTGRPNPFDVIGRN